MKQISITVIGLLWVAMVLAILFNSRTLPKQVEGEPRGTYTSMQAEMHPNRISMFEILKQQHHQIPHADRPSRVRATLTLPKRYTPATHIEPPPPLEEIRANMTVYLHELHSKLEALAGPRVSALTVWETFLDVTKKMPMVG